MKKTRFLIGALSGWQHVDRRERCMETWVHDCGLLNIDMVFLLGVANLTRPERHGNLLFLPCPDDFSSLPQRTRWFCRWALTLDTWDYLFKCDDDTYVAADRLATYDMLHRDYVGAESSPGLGFAAGGAGYLLSRRAAAIVEDSLYHTEGAEDALVGNVLSNAGIILSSELRFVQFGNELRRPKPENDLITLHGVNADTFYASHYELVRSGQTPRLPTTRCGVMLEGFRQFARTIPSGSKAVELGSFGGESTIVLLEHGIRVDAIESWTDDIYNRPEIQRKCSFKYQMFQASEVEATFDQCVKLFGEQVTKRKGRHVDFLEDYADRSLDLIYLNAGGTKDEVLAAIELWWPKIKMGGVLAGSNFSMTNRDVTEAVRERFGSPDRVFADTTWMVTNRLPIRHGQVIQPQIGLLFLTRDNLTKPLLWADWLEGHEDEFSVFVHAKVPAGVSDKVLCGHIIDEYVPTVHSLQFPHHSLAKAQISLLRAALANKTIEKFVFISESTIPIVPASVTYERLLSDDRSWIDECGFCSDRYSQLAVDCFPAAHFLKASQWLVLNTRHAWCCVEAESEFIDRFATVAAADEHYFASILSLADINFETETERRSATYVDWIRGAPYAFANLAYEEVKDMRASEFLFVRKITADCSLPDQLIHELSSLPLRNETSRSV